MPVQICSSIPWGYIHLLKVAVLSYLLRVLVSTEGYCWASEFFSCLCHIHVNTVRFHWWSVSYKWSVADESAMCCINWFIELRGKDLLFMFCWAWWYYELCYKLNIAMIMTWPGLSYINNVSPESCLSSV